MGGPSSPCAACKLLRRRCATGCMFASYFPSDDPQKFAVVHKVFGAGKVSKWLQNSSEEKRAALVCNLVDIANAVSSLVNEANARVEDPVYGCAGVISRLQSQIKLLQSQVAELEAARGPCDMSEAQIPCIQNHEAVKGGKGKEAFETASGAEAAESSDAAVKRKRFAFDLNELPSGVAVGDKQHEGAEASDAAVKRLRFTFDLNELPSDKDEAIMP